MEDGYHINVAIVTNRRAWNSTKDQPIYESTHFCSIYLGRVTEDDAKYKAEMIKARFAEGTEPGQFGVTMTYWQSRGKGIEI
jgi:hypothetical protein